MVTSKHPYLPIQVKRTLLHRVVMWSLPVTSRIPVLKRIILWYMERARFLSIKVGSGPWKRIKR